MKALIWMIRVVLGLFMLALICGSSALLYSSAVQHEDPPVLLGYAPFTVANNEMTPSLYPGDLAILRVGPDCQPGDIVAFRSESQLLLRRIVGTSEEMFITQQEAFGQPDANFLDPARVEAVCVTYLPGCGTVVEFLYSPVGLAVLVVLALGVLVVPIFLTRGTARLEGPAVDYGGPAPYENAPVYRQEGVPAHHRRKELDDYDDEEDGPLYAPAPQKAEDKPLLYRLEEEPDEDVTYVTPPPKPYAQPRLVQPPEPASPARQERPPRRGGSHYKPRH